MVTSSSLNLPAMLPLTTLLRFQTLSPEGQNLVANKTTIPPEEHPIKVDITAEPTASISPSFVMVNWKNKQLIIFSV